MSHPIALIVGGSSGIGLATARQLAKTGTTVHIAGRNTERLSALAHSDPILIGHIVDAGDGRAIHALAESIGSIDYLILTLSGAEGPGRIADLDLAMLRRAFDAKFWGHIASIQAALPFISVEGSITLLGAITARAGMPGTAGIAAINGAVEALVKPLATELAPIRVNAVSPGLVDTPWWSSLPEDARAAYFAQASASLPVGRVATADDIAEVVVLAATNRNTTGTIIETDGGARLVSMG
jgi:NAD(P)-dependent dehydrogenase (short-subunit alcohol dehydrogenase family)